MPIVEKYFSSTLIVNFPWKIFRPKLWRLLPIINKSRWTIEAQFWPCASFILSWMYQHHFFSRQTSFYTDYSHAFWGHNSSVQLFFIIHHFSTIFCSGHSCFWEHFSSSLPTVQRWEKINDALHFCLEKSNVFSWKWWDR